jgi:hypothetical protein
MKLDKKLKRLRMLEARVDAIEGTLARHLVKDHNYEEDDEGRITVEEPMAPATLLPVKEGE